MAQNCHRSIENVRVSYIPWADRKKPTDWAPGMDVLRVQAYRGPTNQRLFMGAEYPIGSEVDVERLIETIREVYAAAQQSVAEVEHNI